MSLGALFKFSFSTQRRKGAKDAKKRFGNCFLDEQVFVGLTRQPSTRCGHRNQDQGRLGKAQHVQQDARKRWARRFAPLPNLQTQKISTRRREGAKAAKFFKIGGEKCAETKTFDERNTTHETIQDDFLCALCALCAFAPLSWISQTTIKPTTP